MTADATALTIGANVSLTELMETLKVAVTKCDKYTYATELVKHLDLVATVPVRNVNKRSEFQFLLNKFCSERLFFISPLILGRNNCWQFKYQTCAQRISIRCIFAIRNDWRTFEYRFD